MVIMVYPEKLGCNLIHNDKETPETVKKREDCLPPKLNMFEYSILSSLFYLT